GDRDVIVGAAVQGIKISHSVLAGANHLGVEDSRAPKPMGFVNDEGIASGPIGSETGEDETDESTTIENILSGQYSHPLRVVAFNTTEGWSRDVTEDIARAVLDRAQKEDRPIGKGAQEFLEHALGVAVLGRLNSGLAP
ncbi:MAG: hypothetical protein WAL49_00015, partial [Pseudolabrys sp.]